MNKQKKYSTAASWLYAALGLCCVATSVFLVETSARADPAGILESGLSNTDGRQVYEHICQGCHMPDAGGAVGAGRYPALSKDPTLASREYMALTILMGRRNMPAFGEKHAIGFGGPPVVLNEAQIAAVINYVRTHFGNHFSGSISAAEVAALDREAR
ncbi:MAG TPA: cytochrome c [Steroidobacteraceae bacterium]